MNELRLLFDKYGTDKAYFHGYDSFYELIIKTKQDHEINLLEIGIHDGVQSLHSGITFPDPELHNSPLRSCSWARPSLKIKRRV